MTEDPQPVAPPLADVLPGVVRSSALGDLKDLAGKSVVYGLGSVLVRGLNFFLLPLYTRYLTPADYGIVALTGTIAAALGILYPLGLHGAVTRFYFAAPTKHERREELGTVWLSMIAIAAVLTLLLLAVGSTVSARLFPEVPYAPYIQLAIVIAFSNVFALVPLNLLQIEERPRGYVIMTAVGTVVTTGLIIVLVVVLRLGAYGYLMGMLLGSAIMAIPYLVMTLRHVRPTFRSPVFGRALAYSLPLVPHGIAGWLLELSDRIILGRYVSLGQLGLYAVGYQFGSIMNVAATAINNAWTPFVFKRVGDQGEAAKPDLARLATYFALIVCWIGLGISLFAKVALQLLTAPDFHEAHHLVPWIVAGYVLQSLYFVPGNFIMIKGRTISVPVATLTAGLANVGLNLWLVPRFGIIAAAWATSLGYAIMLALIWGAASRVYPVAYEYGRIARIIVVCVGLVLLARLVSVDRVMPELAILSILWLAFPGVLALTGFFTPAERSRLRQALAVVRRGRGHGGAS